MLPKLLALAVPMPLSRATAWAPHVRQAAQYAGLTSRRRMAAFLAQVGHESGCFRYAREVWGPTKQQLRYEPSTTLSQRLGNVVQGDGLLYMGRGPLQVTGRANYADLTRRLKARVGSSVPDFEADPEALAAPVWGMLAAAEFWRNRGLNRFADSGNFSELTRRINGGYNGLAHRQQLHANATLALLRAGY